MKHIVENVSPDLAYVANECKYRMHWHPSAGKAFQFTILYLLWLISVRHQCFMFIQCSQKLYNTSTKMTWKHFHFHHFAICRLSCVHRTHSPAFQQKSLSRISLALRTAHTHTVFMYISLPYGAPCAVAYRMVYLAQNARVAP